MRSIFRPVKLLCGSLLFINILAANGSDDKTSGIREYEAAHYDTAIKYFSAALIQSPDDAVIHYYLANSLSQLKQFDSAIKAYNYSLTLSKDEKLSRYCQNAINSLEKRIGELPKPDAAKPGTKDITDQTDSASTTGTKKKSLPVGQLTLNQANPNLRLSDPLRHAIDRINGQADTGGKSLQTEGKTLAKRKADSHDLKIAKLREEEAARLDYMQNTVAYDCFGKPYHLFTETEIRLAKENYELKILEAQNNSASEVQSVLDQGLQKEKALNETAKSLVSQLGKTTAANPGAVQLLPTGTNIYVRNYLSTRLPASDPQPRELLATQDKMILDAHKREGKWHYSILPDGLTAKQESLALNPYYLKSNDKSAKFTNTGVHGQLLAK